MTVRDVIPDVIVCKGSKALEEARCARAGAAHGGGPGAVHFRRRRSAEPTLIANLYTSACEHKPALLKSTLDSNSILPSFRQHGNVVFALHKRV